MKNECLGKINNKEAKLSIKHEFHNKIATIFIKRKQFKTAYKHFILANEYHKKLWKSVINRLGLALNKNYRINNSTRTVTQISEDEANE